MAYLRRATGFTLILLATLESLCASPPAASDGYLFTTSYDFTIVGGGTAGNAVGTRLSQQLPDCSILIVEAGDFAPAEDRINIPGLKGSTLGTKYDWNFTSIPQPQLNGRVITQSRGKVLGGSSALNLMIWDRGSAKEYDGWEEVGNPGWGFQTMIQAMNKAENFTNPGAPIYTGSTGYGTEGPINAVVDRYRPAQQSTWIPTFKSFGITHNTDWLAGHNLGAAFHSSTIDPTHYNRSYSAVEYLPLAGPNLEVRTSTEVAKVNLEKSDGRYVATGVTLMNGDVITARKEVIVSAGTIKSPAILELSGIGGETLQAVGAEKVINLPGVGENLQDHPRIQLSFQLKDNYTSFDKLKVDPVYAAEQLALWKTGKLSAYDYAAGAFSYQNWSSIVGKHEESLVNAAKRVVASSENNVVDKKKLEYLTDPQLSATIAQAEFILSDGYSGVRGYPVKGDPLYAKGFTTIFAGLMHPLARGYVHINSSDASVNPVYNPAFASNEYDLRALVILAKYVRTIAQDPPFSTLWESEYEPREYKVQTNEQWKTYVLGNLNTFYHPVGTCAMLPRRDGGVVDPKLKVYGTHQPKGGRCERDTNTCLSTSSDWNLRHCGVSS